MSKVQKFFEMEPMKYYDRAEKGLSDNLKAKRNALIENKDNAFIATQKWDGYWGMFIKGETNDDIFIRGRSLNVRHEYENYALKLPHLAEEMKGWPSNTVVLAEMCWSEMGRIATDVGTVLRCLPKQAILRQSKEKIIGSIFDVLMYNGTDISAEGYEKRIYFAQKTFADSKYFQVTEIYTNDFAAHADDIIARKGEGIVIQRKDNPYFMGKRPAWKTLKLKQKFPEIELPVVKVLEPKQFSDGDTDGSAWLYKDADGNKLTKAFANGWKVGVVVDFNGVEVGVTSGVNDDEKEWLATQEASDYIREGRLYAVVKAMQINTLGSLRHPVLVRLRTDLDK